MRFSRTSLAFFVLLVGCSKNHRTSSHTFPSKFQLDVSNDILETLSGNTFVANIRELNPVFGMALKIKVRDLPTESILDNNSSKVNLAFRQWHQFRLLVKEAKSIEIRNLERAEDGFFVWADVYLNGKILKSLY